MAVHIITVDLQNDFCAEGGPHYRPRACVPFIRETLLPFAREHGCRVAEIVSDYRATEPRIGASTCTPGRWGYQSLVPADVKHPSVWVKAAPSPPGRARVPGKRTGFRGDRIRLQMLSARGSKRSPDRRRLMRRSSSWA